MGAVGGGEAAGEGGRDGCVGDDAGEGGGDGGGEEVCLRLIRCDVEGVVSECFAVVAAREMVAAGSAVAVEPEEVGKAVAAAEAATRAEWACKVVAAAEEEGGGEA